MQQIIRVLTIILIIVAQADTFDAWTYRSWLYVTDSKGNAVEWDPCRDLQWFDAQTKGTDPMFAGIETFTSPMYSDAVVVPGGGTKQLSDMCALDTKTNTWNLKDGWELFHRDLLTTDDQIATTGGISYQTLAKASYGKEPRIPSFSLYHKKTGNLRTYLWRSSEIPIEDNIIGIEEEIAEGLTSTIYGANKANIRHGFSMEGSGYSMAIPLAQMLVSTKC